MSWKYHNTVSSNRNHRNGLLIPEIMKPPAVISLAIYCDISAVTGIYDRIHRNALRYVNKRFLSDSFDDDANSVLTIIIYFCQVVKSIPLLCIFLKEC